MSFYGLLPLVCVLILCLSDANLVLATTTESITANSSPTLSTSAASSTASVPGATASVDSSTASASSSTASVPGATASVPGATASVDSSTASVSSTTASFGSSTASVPDATASAGSTTASFGSSTASVPGATALVGSSTASAGSSTALVGNSTTSFGSSTASVPGATASAGSSTALVGSSTTSVDSSTASAVTDIPTVSAASGGTSSSALSSTITTPFSANNATPVVSTANPTQATTNSLISSTMSMSPPNASNNGTYVIGLALAWTGDDMSTEINRQFKTIAYPAITAACPTSSRINRTTIKVEAVSIDLLPTLTLVTEFQDILSDGNFLFIGVKNSPLTVLLQAVNSTTTVPGYPRLNYHPIAPIPINLLQDALIKVIKQRIAESLYPGNTNNYRACLFIDDTIQITEMTALFDFFEYGLIFFRYNDATVQESLLETKRQGIINIIALLPATMGDGLKLAAYKLNMLAYHYRWFFHGPRLVNAPFDLRMVTNSTNITSLEFGRIQDALRKDLRTTSAVLVYDLVSIWQFYIRQYLCNESSPVNRVFLGYSGVFNLYPSGAISRVNWQLQIYRGLEARQQQVGTWSSDGSFSMLRMLDWPRSPDMALAELKLNVFRIVTIITPPYVKYVSGSRDDTMPLRDQLNGMYIDLCKQILANLHITNYEFFVQEDNAYGVFNNSWNGIIRTIIDGRAHLGCAPMTVETSRQAAVAFSSIVHSSPQSILYKTPASSAYVEMFQFLQPLDTMIWLTVLAVLVFVAIVLAVMNWIIPNEKPNLTISHSLFFSFAEVVQGTAGSVPNQVSSRIVVAFFWFFTLFLLLTYIANYAAFRLFDGVQQEVNSLQTLLQNSAFEFGVIKNTVTVTLLQASTFVYMQQIYGLLADTFANGLLANETIALQVINNASQRFALIGDNLQNQYLADTNCDLVNTGQFYELRSGLVMPLHSEYDTFFNFEINNMSDYIRQLQNTYFNVKNNDPCGDNSLLYYVKKYTPREIWPVKEGALTLTNTLGIALINIFGCIFALLLSAIERAFSRLLDKRSAARRKTQVSEAFAMAQRPRMLE